MGQVGPSCPQAYVISSSEGNVTSLQESVDLSCQLRLLIGLNSDGLCDCYIINTLGDVGSDSLCVLLEVCGVVAACLNIFQSVVLKQSCRASEDPSGHSSICLRTGSATLTSGLYSGISMTDAV